MCVTVKTIPKSKISFYITTSPLSNWLVMFHRWCSQASWMQMLLLQLSVVKKKEETLHVYNEEKKLLTRHVTSYLK